MVLARSPIGGQKISSFGGVLGFLPFQGILPATGSPPPTVGQTILDVMRGDLLQISDVDDTTDSGSWGAGGADVVCIRFRAKAHLKWDLRNPPNFLTRNGAQLSQENFNLGYQLWFYVGSGLDYPSDLKPYYWYCPSCKGAAMNTIMDANARKKVEAEIEIVSNAPLFALGGLVNDQANLDRYIAHCRTRNWVW